MTENEILNLGFIPNLDAKGNKLSFHPEGVTYTIEVGDFIFFTTEFYNYLWVSLKGDFRHLISRKLNRDILNIAMSFKEYSDIKFIGID